MQLVPPLSSFLFLMLEKLSSFSLSSYFLLSRLPAVFSWDSTVVSMSHKGWDTSELQCISAIDPDQMTSEFCKVCSPLAAWGSLPHYCLPCLILPYVLLIIKCWGNLKKDRSMCFYSFKLTLSSALIASLSCISLLPMEGDEPWCCPEISKKIIRPINCMGDQEAVWPRHSSSPQATSFWRKPLIFGRQTRLGIQSIYQWQTNIKQWQTASSGFGEGLLGWKSTDSAFIRTNF